MLSSLEGLPDVHSKTCDVLTSEVKELRTLVVDLKRQITEQEDKLNELSEPEVSNQDIITDEQRDRGSRTKRGR